MLAAATLILGWLAVSNPERGPAYAWEAVAPRALEGDELAAAR